MWNKNSEQYNSQSARKVALGELSNFLEGKTAEDIEKMFHSLRTLFSREHKNTKSEWRHLKSLEFLLEDQTSTSSEQPWSNEEVNQLIEFYIGMC